MSFRKTPSRFHGPSAGPAEANGLPKAYGPLKSMGPGGKVPPCPLSAALVEHMHCRRCYVTWFGADSPKTIDSEV